VALFVTLEGGEGAGKSLLAAALAERLAGTNVVLTFEPGDTPLGALLREQLFNEALPLSPWAETFLFLAERAIHVSKVIRPALARGAPVICDRFVDSTVAYQGYGRRLDPPLIKLMNQQATNGLLPQITLLLDVPVEEGLRRTRNERGDRIGREAIEFHRRVAEGFKRIALKEPDRIQQLDANRPASEVLETAWTILEPRLAAAGHRGSR
jgi:dTMP kinase